MDNSCDRLHYLLKQLPSLLEVDFSSSLHTHQQEQYTPPTFRIPTSIPSIIYLWDEAEQVVKEFLSNNGYQNDCVLLILPKIAGSFLVLDIKSLHLCNSEIPFSKFVSDIQILFQGFSHPLFEKAISVGIFINIYLSIGSLLTESRNIMQYQSHYGMLYHNYRTDHKLLMEYSSPNMAKSMTIGHFRNTIIGQIIYNILLQTSCYHLNRNYIGDRGTAFGKFVTILFHTYQKDPSIVEKIVLQPQRYIGPLYAQFKDLLSPDKDNEARKIVILMEQGNPLIKELRTLIRRLSMIDFYEVYGLLDISFDCTLGESFSVSLDNNVLDDLHARDIIHSSQGAMIIKLKRMGNNSWRPLTSNEIDQWREGVDQVMVFSKSDGSTLYAPRDLALLKYRSQQLHADRFIYVVGSEQNIYFEHLISLGEYLGRIVPGSMIHLSYGLYLQDGKKMSSRTGGALGAYELIETIAGSILEQSEGKIDKQIAEKLAVSALIINDTKGDITKDVNLDIAAITKLTGDTGIYIQYTMVRMRSLIVKLEETLISGSILGGSADSGFHSVAFDEGSSLLYYELGLDQLLFLSICLPIKIKQSIEYMKPHVLTQYLLELAATFNKRYNNTTRLLDKTDGEKVCILHSLNVYSLIYRKVMSLLHLPEVERM